MKEYSKCSIHLNDNGPFVIVCDGNGTEKVVRKSSLCWYFSNNKRYHSSDRLHRVKEVEPRIIRNTAFPEGEIVININIYCRNGRIQNE